MGPNQQFINIGENANGGPVPPSGTFWFGTDSNGRDLFVRVLYGARVSLLVGVLATAISVALGVVFGLAAGYIGGLVDSLIARVIDVMLSIPLLLIAISVAYISGPGIWLVIVIVGVLSFTYLARIVRGQVISLKEKEYIQAARALGAGPWRIMFTDLLPNVMAQVIVYASLLIPLAIVTEAALSFLGVGVPPPAPDWGQMINDASGYYQYGYWWYLLFPSLALLITTLAFNIFGDSVRDAFDPRGGGCSSRSLCDPVSGAQTRAGHRGAVGHLRGRLPPFLRRPRAEPGGQDVRGQVRHGRPHRADQA